MASVVQNSTHDLPRKGADIVCDVLLAHGVHTLFGYTGGAILPFYDALTHYPDLHHVTVRHEQAAAHAAAGYARATGKAGVCVTTSGPGATNLITGIMDAHLDSTPLVVLSGQVSTALIGSDAFQETDMMCITATITKHNFQPRHIDELEEMLYAAFYLAQSGRPGPVYVDLPKNILEAQTQKRVTSSMALPGYNPKPAFSMSQLEHAYRVICSATQPLLLIGGGAVHANASAVLQQLAETLQIPVVSTIMGKGVISEYHEQVLGPIGMYGKKSAQHALMYSDVLIAFGCRFSDRITGKVKEFSQHKTIIHIDIDAYELGKNVPAHIPIQGDVLDVAQAMLTAFQGYQPSQNQQVWMQQLKRARDICTICVPHKSTVGVHPKHVMDVLNKVRGSQDIVTTGVGQHQMFASHFLMMSQSRTFVTSCGAGTMGYGVPAAIGACFANNKARVFVVDGDGSFQMTSQELATIAQEGICPIILILDNQQLGMVRQWQDRVYDSRYQSVWFDAQGGHPDWVMLAQAYGLSGANVTTLEQLEAAIEAALHRKTATLIRVLVDSSVDMLPMMPSGATLHDFYGHCVSEPGKLFNAQETLYVINGSKGS